MKAIVFDVDDTLYDRSQPFREAYEELLEETYPAKFEELYRAVSRRGDEVFEAAQKGEMPMEESHIYRIRMGFADLGIDISREEALEFQHGYARRQGEIRLSPMMRKLLNRLSQSGIPMGLLTNGPVDHQERKIRKLGMEAWIPGDCVVISAACNLAKPDVRIFRYAEKKMDLEGKTVYYVGDSYEKDVLGAAAAGWKTIWINKEKKEITKGMVQPDYMVYDEKELYDCICGLLEREEESDGRKRKYEK